MTKEEKLRHCRGCDDDFYNGNNSFGISECWLLEKAKLVTKYAIGFNTPMNTARNLREVKVLNCFHERGPNRTVYLGKIPSHLLEEWRNLEKSKTDKT